MVQRSVRFGMVVSSWRVSDPSCVPGKAVESASARRASVSLLALLRYFVNIARKIVRALSPRVDSAGRNGNGKPVAGDRARGRQPLLPRASPAGYPDYSACG